MSRSYSRYWTKRIYWDFSASEQASAAFLLEAGADIRARHGAQAILLTLSDWVAVFIERHSTLLETQFLFPRPERPVIHTLANKWGMHRLATEHGIPTPDTICPSSPADVQAFLKTASLPVVLKPADPFLPHPPAKK